jgi:hypothetical protein
LTAQIIKQEVPEVTCLAVGYIKCLILKPMKIPSSIAAQKPLLTKKMKGKRLAFAKKYLNSTEEDWSKVMFSTKSTFHCLRATRSCVHRPTETDHFDSHYMVKTIKHPNSVMVLGCFAGNGGCGGINFPLKNQTMNSVCYLKVLKDHLLDWMDRYGCLHFFQDVAPCHALKVTMAFLYQQDFEIMDWPGPYFNPIGKIAGITFEQVEGCGHLLPAQAEG